MASVPQRYGTSSLLYIAVWILKYSFQNLESQEYLSEESTVQRCLRGKEK